MSNYISQWRGGNKSKNISTAHVQQMLDWCDKHFDLLSSKEVIFLTPFRKYFKNLLDIIGEDIKFDAEAQKV
jgi:hypothetical protein